MAQQNESRIISLKPIVDELGLHDSEMNATVLLDESDAKNAFNPDPNHIPIQIKQPSGLQPYEQFASNTYGNLIAIAFNPDVSPASLNLRQNVVLIRIDEGKPAILRLIQPKDRRFAGKKGAISGLRFVTPSVLQIERIRDQDDWFERTYEFYDVLQHKVLGLNELPIRNWPSQMRLTLLESGLHSKELYAPPKPSKIVGDVRALRNRYFTTVEKTSAGEQVVYYQLDPVRFELIRVANVLFEGGSAEGLFHNIVDERSVFADGDDGLVVEFSHSIRNRWKRLMLKLSPREISLKSLDDGYDSMKRVQGRPELTFRASDRHKVELQQDGQTVMKWASPLLDWGTGFGSNDEGIVLRTDNHPNYRYLHLLFDGRVVQLTPDKYRLIQTESDHQTLRGLSTWTPDYDFSFFVSSITTDGRLPAVPENLRFAGKLAGPDGVLYPLVETLEIPGGVVARKVSVLRKSPHQVVIFDPQQPALSHEIYVLGGALNVFYDDAGKIILWNPESQGTKVLDFKTLEVVQSNYKDVVCKMAFGGPTDLTGQH